MGQIIQIKHDLKLFNHNVEYYKSGWTEALLKSCAWSFSQGPIKSDLTFVFCLIRCLQANPS